MSSTSSAADQARENLRKIEHFVVLMLENRSFDQMLGYLQFEGHDVDGFKREADEPPLVNWYSGKSYEPQVAERTALTKAEDPCHHAWCVAEQLSERNGERNGGFVENFAATHPAADPSAVMEYYTAEQVPVYNHLAEQFCVCDRWFCSVPAATWPNRLYAVTGTAAGSLDNELPPLYRCKSFLRQLDEVRDLSGTAEPSWRWYSSDPGTLRFIDDRYFLELSDRFAYFDTPTMLQQRTFLRDAAAGELPSFSWIDPNFVDLGGLQGANDDHPPSDIMAGQELALKVYNAVATSPLREQTLLLIVYDEHGGFYDHVSPDDFTPPGGLPDEDRRFRRYGPRVPAIVVSPWVEPRRHSHAVLDHTSIIKTALLRFCGSHAEEHIRAMGPCVAQARHLGELLTRDTPRKPPYLDENKVVEPLVRWRAREIRRRLLHPLADESSLVSAEPAHAGMVVFNKLRNGIIEQLSRVFGRRPRLPGAPKPSPLQLQQPRHEFEQSIFAGAREVRRRGLPTGHP
jgi:phospholipase C